MSHSGSTWGNALGICALGQNALHLSLMFYLQRKKSISASPNKLPCALGQGLCMCCFRLLQCLLCSPSRPSPNLKTVPLNKPCSDTVSFGKSAPLYLRYDLSLSLTKSLTKSVVSTWLQSTVPASLSPLKAKCWSELTL